MRSQPNPVMEVTARGRKAKNRRIKFADFLNPINQAASRKKTFAVVKVVEDMITIAIVFPHLLLYLTSVLCKLEEENNCSGYSVKFYYSFLTTLAISFVHSLVLCVCLINVVTLLVGLPFCILLDIIMVITVHWVWTELPQYLLLTYTGIEESYQVADKPQYHIDTTQRHYIQGNGIHNSFTIVKHYFLKKTKWKLVKMFLMLNKYQEITVFVAL